MSTSPDAQGSLMPTRCQEMGLESLERLTQSIVQDIASLKLLNTELSLSQLSSLGSGYHKGLAVIHTLINTTCPINRLPPEILGHIFALIPRRRLHQKAGHCPFTEIVVEDLHKPLEVCRYWRELVLTAQTLLRTISTNRGGLARHSVFLSDNPSLELSVHVTNDTRSGYPGMEEFLLSNAPRIRELHCSDAFCIADLPSFLQSFDANALEKCLLVSGSQSQFTSNPCVFIPLFSGGGTMLRSLCLGNFPVLPKNKFPILSSFMLCLNGLTAVSWNIGDLLKFVTGCPMLEEIHVCGVWFTMSMSSHNSHTIDAPISLPRLRYLFFQCLPNREAPVDDAIITVDFLLERIVIPSNCHLYLHAPGELSKDSETNCRIFDSVRCHIPQKSRTSHIALWLPDPSNPNYIGLQLVFPGMGSLRLRFTTPPYMSPGPLNVGSLLHFLRAYPDIFATTVELRIHYNDKGFMSTADVRYDIVKDLRDALPAVLPNITLVSTIAGGSCWEDNLRTCFHLLSPMSSDSDVVPFPALETLWVMLPELKEDFVDHFRWLLTKRAKLGSPARRAIVAYKLPECQTPGARQDRRDVRKILGLEGIVDEVILMKIPPQERPSEVDWMVWYPEKYELPSDVRRDWPAW